MEAPAQKIRDTPGDLHKGPGAASAGRGVQRRRARSRPGGSLMGTLFAEGN